MCLLDIYLLTEMFICSFCPLIYWVVFLLLTYKNFSIFFIYFSHNIYDLEMFSHILCFAFLLSWLFLAHYFFYFGKVQFIFSPLSLVLLALYLRNHFLNSKLQRFTLISSKDFIIIALALKCQYMTHLELIFVCGMKEGHADIQLSLYHLKILFFPLWIVENRICSCSTAYKFIQNSSSTLGSWRSKELSLGFLSPLEQPFYKVECYNLPLFLLSFSSFS